MYPIGRAEEQAHSGIDGSSPAALQKDDHVDIALLSEREPQQPAAWSNASQQRYACEKSVQQLVEYQAAIRPAAPALVTGDQILSYQALNQQANQVAHALRALGVGPEVPVGLCLERTPDLMVGLLGILKAGGAYVPLDPMAPPERLAFLLEDTQMPLLLTHSSLLAHLPATSTRLICLDTEPLLDQQSQSNPSPTVSGEHLAYILYTSGSTGQPKGVQITHQSLRHLIDWHLQAFALTSADRTTQIASPAFDATGWELWPSLCAGACVFLVDEEIRAQACALRDWLVEHQITVSFLPTPLAEQALALDWPPETALRYLLTGADTLHLYPRADLPFALINNYGPTEATVVATSGRIWPQAQTETPPPIGRPIGSTEVYLLDEQLQLVAPGEPGELHIGGPSLARGYLNRPELTRERFIAHPFSNTPGARLYKTGDLARWLPDGHLAFLGRLDQQIKLRGYRIEPDEIVCALQRHPAIRSSVVVARDDPPAEKRLVAYVVPHPGQTISLAALREMLTSSLPAYMVPATFVQLEALPITPNGKVDRAALPAPTPTNILHEEVCTAPSTPLEAQIAQVVADLLHIEQVGVEENFFLLGGHSLLGAQLITWVSETFGLELPLRTLFEAPTVRQVAAEVERRLRTWVEALSEEDASRLLA